MEEPEDTEEMIMEADSMDILIERMKKVFKSEEAECIMRNLMFEYEMMRLRHQHEVEMEEQKTEHYIEIQKIQAGWIGRIFGVYRNTSATGGK